MDYFSSLRRSSSLVAVTRIRDILLSLKLPENAVSVQRAYDELSEPYFKEFNYPLGEGTGCIPIEHRDFVISEIRRLFEEELNYIQQPPSGCLLLQQLLPPHAVALVDNAGWMGDILSAGECMDTVTNGSIIRDIRVENSMASKVYVRTEKKDSSSLERRGVGFLLREFFIFYALKWNDTGTGSVFHDINALYNGWTDALETFNVFQSLISGLSLLLSYVVKVEGSVLKIPSVDRLLELLCTEGLIVVVQTSQSKLLPVVKRMTVLDNCTPVASIINYFRNMLEREWIGICTVEVTANDVVRALNRGDVGAYRKSCVPQFMRPFLFDGSVEGYSWKEGIIHMEKYVINVDLISERVSRFLTPV